MLNRHPVPMTLRSMRVSAGALTRSPTSLSNPLRSSSIRLIVNRSSSLVEIALDDRMMAHVIAVVDQDLNAVQASMLVALAVRGWRMASKMC